MPSLPLENLCAPKLVLRATQTRVVHILFVEITSVQSKSRLLLLLEVFMNWVLLLREAFFVEQTGGVVRLEG